MQLGWFEQNLNRKRYGMYRHWDNIYFAVAGYAYLIAQETIRQYPSQQNLLNPQYFPHKNPFQCHVSSLCDFPTTTLSPITDSCYIEQRMNRSSLGEDESSLIASYKIIILGMASAGKTKLLTRYKYGNYLDEGSQTMMVDCTYVYRNRVKYNYYDTAGQQKYRSILNLYFKGSDAAILVYSVDSMKSFEELEYYYKELMNVVPDCKIYVIGCKNDLKKSVTKEKAKEHYKAVRYFQSSAKLDQGVYEAFHEIEKDLLQLKKEKKPEMAKFELDSSQIKQRKKQKCCSSN